MGRCLLMTLLIVMGCGYNNVMADWPHVTWEQARTMQDLIEATRRNNTPFIRNYVYRNPKNPNPAIEMCWSYSPWYGWTYQLHNSILHCAAKYGHFDIVSIVLQHGGAVNAINARGETPLHKAAKHGQFHIVDLLLVHTANPCIQDHTGNIPTTSAYQIAYDPRAQRRKSVDPADVHEAIRRIITFAIRQADISYLDAQSYIHKTYVQYLCDGTRM